SEEVRFGCQSKTDVRDPKLTLYLKKQSSLRKQNPSSIRSTQFSRTEPRPGLSSGCPHSFSTACGVVGGQRDQRPPPFFNRSESRHQSRSLEIDSPANGDANLRGPRRNCQRDFSRPSLPAPLRRLGNDGAASYRTVAGLPRENSPDAATRRISRPDREKIR